MPVAVGVLVVGRRPQGIVGILAFFLVLDALVGLGGRYDLTVPAVLLAVALWFTLEWYDTTPDWARPPVDATARVAAVEALAARVATAASEPEVAAALADVPAALSVTASGSALRFQPPMPAADVVRAFGWTGAVAHLGGSDAVASVGFAR